MKHYIHEGGRRCLLGPDGKWRHFDHPTPEPGPKERIDYECRMDHWIRHMKDGPLPDMTERELANVPTPFIEVEGMPTLGSSVAGLIGDFGVAPGRVHRVVPGCQVDISRYPETDLAKRIIEKHLPEAMDHFLMRNAEYGDDDDFNLGVRGQYVDISRKVQKLKRRWWGGESEPDEGAGESTRVIVMELIGHLLMSLDYMDQTGYGMKHNPDGDAAQ